MHMITALMHTIYFVTLTWVRTENIGVRVGIFALHRYILFYSFSAACTEDQVSYLSFN